MRAAMVEKKEALKESAKAKATKIAGTFMSKVTGTKPDRNKDLI
jgi:hypothetical protein